MCEIFCLQIYIISYMCYVTGWQRGEKRVMKFAIPQIWQQPTDPSSNCNFRIVDSKKGRLGTNVPQIIYLDIPSFITPAPHSPERPVPTPPKEDQPSSGESSKSNSEEDIGDTNYSFAGAVERSHISLTRKTSTI